MATLPFSSPQIANPFPFSSTSPKPFLTFTIRASDFDSVKPDAEGTETKPTSSDDEFENRISQLRVRYRSGTGKKAEIRKVRKSKKSTASGSNVYLPPVSLKEPVSGGLKVDFGFSPYSERINGKLALVGLTALLLVELISGKSVLNYHTPTIVFIQIYFMAAVSALYVKYEKEKISVWPQSSTKE